MSNHVHIRVDHEWADFFWREWHDARDGRDYYGACWTAYTSFGVFGHLWSSMGEPFAKFIADIDDSYLLGKISSREFSLETMRESFERSIQDAILKEKRLTAKAGGELLDRIRKLANEYDGPVLCHMIYCDKLIGKKIDLAEISTQDFPIQARMFVQKLWPVFVKKVGETSADPVTVCRVLLQHENLHDAPQHASPKAAGHWRELTEMARAAVAVADGLR